MDPIREFRTQLESAGLLPPELAPDGVLRRCATRAKPRSDNGWYVLFSEPWAGAYGDWARNSKEVWNGAGNGGDMDPETRRRLQARIEQAKVEREQEQARRHAKAAEGAWKIIDGLPPATPGTPYFKRKGVSPCSGIKEDNGTAVVPVSGPDGKIQSLQRIDADGDKKFLTGGKVAGGYFPINKGGTGRLIIGEGIATLLTCIEADPTATALAAFNAGNLQAVAEMARKHYPERPIIIASDDDAKTEAKTGRNPGKEAAEAAARAVNGKVAFPSFEDPEGGSDFNDLAALKGIEAVKNALDAAKGTPAVMEVDPCPDPVPLPDGLPPVAPFDFALLPETLKPWAADIVERMQCPADYVAVTVIVCLAAIIGRKVGIKPQAPTDWTVLVNLWALLIGRPGWLKSPAMEKILSVLKRLAAVALERYQDELAEYDITKIAEKLRTEAVERQARAMLKENPGADISRLFSIDKSDAPILRRYMANDTTAAALGELLRQNPNGLLVFRDELVSLLKMLDQEENSEARGFYLTGWNGDSPYTFDRITRGMNLHIPAVCLSLLGSTQPARIAQYVKGAVTGTSDDGLLQRFGLLVWPDTSGTWQEVDRWPDGDAKRKAFEVFDRLERLDPFTIGARQDTGINGEPDGVPYLRFDPAGLDLFRGWRQDLETKLRSGELHPALESHFAKYRKLVPALALTLHLSNGDTGPVGSHAVLQALAWSEYLATHARRLYASITAPEVTTAKAILKKIRNGDLNAVFTGWQVWRPSWSGLTDRKAVNEALDLLVDFGWIVSRRKDTGGRPSIEYEVNPKANLEGVK
jgi:putative DNA primase/helicase